MLWALLFAAVYLYLICPNLRGHRRERMRVFSRQYIAHRGLFDNAGSAPENSLAAFRKAADAGYGIELDVRLTKDGEVVVMHDEDLSRAAGSPQKVADSSYAELSSLRLFASNEAPPRLADVLTAIGGRVP
ncbi:MAG: glycerophosphodiester phosphodiesterase family protein, partial [Methanocorpusculum sp.]|nr:glycerophosphodiester phosphodiesterase family protein [Methanocorpusculum sp.]